MAQRTENVDAITPHTPAKDPKTNYERRREQVRRAQKKHREQKDLQIRALEDELYRLYSLTSMADELTELRFEIDILRDIIARHSIQLPSSSGPQNLNLAQVTIFGDHGPGQHLSVKIPESSGHVFENPDSDSNAGLDPQKATPSREICSINQLNLTQMGINFVLSLERPCLFHTRSPDCDAPSGHAMSMQGILLAGAPLELQDQTSWEVPAQQLDKLFELSGYLGLDGYITPIQAWNRIMRDCDVESFSVQRLEILRAAMVPHIKCYGFGALMEEEIFEQLFQEMMS